MPLRDHFRPPLDNYASWTGFHGGWPMVIVQHMIKSLPDGYIAEPRAQIGGYYEIDVAAFERDDLPASSFALGNGNGVAIAVAAPPTPTLTLETDLPDQYEYEVLVYDQKRGRRLVAAIEIVSPANKDRPEHRQAFVAKSLALLQQGVSVSIVDLVTVRGFNLYAELLDQIGLADPKFPTESPPLYAVTCRTRKTTKRGLLDVWSFPMNLGQPLPAIPIWLAEDRPLTVDLEASYEETCRVLRLPL
jgi:hypothetical protein